MLGHFSTFCCEIYVTAVVSCIFCRCCYARIEMTAKRYFHLTKFTSNINWDGKPSVKWTQPLFLSLYSEIVQTHWEVCTCMTTSHRNAFRITWFLRGIQRSVVDFPQKRSEMLSFNVVFDVSFDKLLNNQSSFLAIWGAFPFMWRHCNGSTWTTNR